MAKATGERALLVAITSGVTAMPDSPLPLVVRQGDTLWSDHPAVKRNPDWFAPLTVTHETPGSTEPRIEQATAAPGEKRGA
jgi:hypothetical protein